MRRGDIWWASIDDPQGPGPGFRRPVVILQSNEFNHSTLRTTICVVVTSNLRLAAAPGNVRLMRKASGLGKESVVNVSQLLTVDKQRLSERVGRVSAETLQAVDAGVRLVLAL